MEFCSANFYDTTTQIAVNSNTLTAGYVLSRDIRRQYTSQGFNNDLTTSTMTISFDETTTIDRIVMLGHNIKGMNIYYGGVTANAFVLTGPTTTSQFTGNTETSLYMPITTPIAVTSVTFDFKSTMVANSEKAIGYILLTAKEYTFPRVPAAGDYKPVLKPKELKHELSTGGIRTHVVDQKWNVKLKYKYFSSTDRDSLKTIYDDHETKAFIPFNTTSGWDGIVFESNWTGPFEFYAYSDNASSSGFSGSITLEET